VVTLHALPPVARPNRAWLTSEPRYRFFTCVRIAEYRDAGSFTGNCNLAQMYDNYIVFGDFSRQRKSLKYKDIRIAIVW
jgi:hypothetical protein